MTTCVTEGCNNERIIDRRICEQCKYKRRAEKRKNNPVVRKQRVRESDKPMEECELFGGSKYSSLLSRPMRAQL